MKVNVSFHKVNSVNESDLKYAVIVSRYKDKWVFVKHKKRLTWEVPGGTRELNENILNTAKRELYEETGATKYDLKEVCEYCVSIDNKSTYGRLFYVEIFELGNLPDLEIEEVALFADIPNNLTYKDIQPKLFDYIKNSFIN